MKVVQPTSEGLREASDALHNGDVVAYPTETVYGLGVDPHSEVALARLLSVKGRDAGHTMLMIAGSLEQVEALSGTLSSRARAYADAFWPGPLSLVLPALAGMPKELLGPDGRLCIRWSAASTAVGLCEAFGGAIVSTSANVTGIAPARSIDDAMLDGVAVGIDGGVLEERVASTVFDPEKEIVLREGAISAASLAGLIREG